MDGVKNWQAGKSPLPGKMTPFSVTGVKQVERQSIRFRACLTTVAPTGMKWVDFAHTPPLPIALSDGAGGQFYGVRVKFPKCMEKCVAVRQCDGNHFLKPASTGCHEIEADGAENLRAFRNRGKKHSIYFSKRQS